MATQGQFLDRVLALLDAGTDPNVKTKDGKSPPPHSPLREPHARLRRGDGEPGARCSSCASPRTPWPRACGWALGRSERVDGSPAMARARVGDYVRVDPGRGGETVVRVLIKRDERQLLRALDERCLSAPATRKDSVMPWEGADRRVMSARLANRFPARQPVFASIPAYLHGTTESLRRRVNVPRSRGVDRRAATFDAPRPRISTHCAH